METRRIQLEESESVTGVGFLIPFNRPSGAAYELKEYFTIGRDDGCHLILNDSFVSARHARIEKRNQGYVLRDQNSRNGTYLNGSRVTEVILSANDKVRFGESIFVFTEAPTGLPQLASKNLEWSQQLQRLPAFAATDFPILITGPSGTGKDILARWIHKNSNRGRGHFVSINCSALSESLIESELFGHIKGSFTGATENRKGAFETARGGVLFLDEIGDLPLSLQPKLLRALENNEIRPVGSDKIVETNVRIIAATHKNMVQNVRSGAFREDLYYRLNVCHIQPPSLVERLEDFDELLYLFAKALKVRFSFAAIQKLKEHSWPGNIRELRNTVSRAAAYFPAKHIQPEDVEHIVDRVHLSPEVHYVTSPGASGEDPNAAKGSLIREIERDLIIRRLVANRGNQRRTAEDLGLPKSTLHDRIKAYSIDLANLMEQMG